MSGCGYTIDKFVLCLFNDDRFIDKVPFWQEWKFPNLGIRPLWMHIVTKADCVEGSSKNTEIYVMLITVQES